MIILYILAFTFIALLLLITLLYEQYWILFTILIISIFLNYPLGIEIFGLPLTTQKIGMIISILFLFPILLFNRHPISPLTTPITIPFLFLIIIAFLSSLYARYPQASYKGLVTLILIFIGIHTLYYLIKISNPEQIKQVLSLGITIVLIALLGLAIIQFVQKGELVGRMTGTFENPNEFSALALMVLPLILAGMEEGNPKFIWMGGISCVLALTTIYFTYSRATYLATIFFMGIIIVGNSIFSPHKKSILLNKKMLVGLSIIITIGLLTHQAVPQEFFEHGVERYQSIFGDSGLNIEASSISKRYNAIWVSLNFFRENPFLGIGIKNFSAYSTRLFGVGNISATENTYLNLLSELGLFGFFIYLFIIFRIFRILIENQKKIKTNYLKCLNKYLTYGFITFLFLMTTNDFLDDMRTFWVWAIVIISLKDLDNRLDKFTDELEKIEN